MKGYFISGAQKLNLDNVYTHCNPQSFALNILLSNRVCRKLIEFKILTNSIANWVFALRKTSSCNQTIFRPLARRCVSF